MHIYGVPEPIICWTVRQTRKVLQIPFYQQYLDSAEAHIEKQTPLMKKYMVEAYNNIAGYALYKDDKEKGKTVLG